MIQTRQIRRASTSRLAWLVAALFTLDAIPMVAQDAYQSYLLGLSPTLYYRLDEGPGAGAPAANLGSAGALGDGIYELGAMESIPGAIPDDNAISCSGGAVALPGGIVATGSLAFSVSFFMSPASAAPGNFATPFSYGGLEPPYQNNCLIIAQDGVAGTAGLRVGRYGGDFLISQGQLTVGEWNHVGLTYDGTNAWLYINGLLDSSATVKLSTLNDSVWLGALIPGDGQAYSGGLDEFAYWTGKTLLDMDMYHLANLQGPPVITRQPQSQVAVPGDDSVFHVSAVGEEPLAYQWLKDNAPLSNATNANLLLADVQVADAGDYQVVITNSFGSTTSVVASLTVAALPSFTQQPRDRTVIPGGNATFTLMVIGTQPMAYQWLKDNAPLPDATNSSLVLANVQVTDAGSYQAVISNSAGSVTSLVATLTVITNAASYEYYLLTLKPTLYFRLDETPSAGATAMNLGSANLSTNAIYKEGATASIPGVISGDNAIACNGGAVQVTGGIVATGNVPFSVSFWMSPASAGAGNWATPFSYGGLEPPYQSNCVIIAQNGTGGTAGLRIGQYGSDFLVSQGQLSVGEWNHVGLTYDGTIASLYINGVLDSTSEITLSALNESVWLGALLPGNGQPYSGGLDEFAYWTGTTLSDTEIYHLANPPGPPTVTQQPKSLTLVPGEDCTFHVGAIGDQPLTYQWLKNNTTVPNATNADLVLTNVQVADAGSYQAVVSNASGNATSSAAVLTVIARVIYQDYVLSLNPTLYYRLNEAPGAGAAAVNLGSAGAGGDAIYGLGAAESIPGAIPGDTAISCTGGAASLPPGILATENNPFSVSFWMKPSSFGAGNYGTPFSYGGYAPPFQGTSLIIAEDGGAGTGKLAIGVYGGNFLVSQGSLTLGQWNHVGLIYNGTNASLYIDGALDSSADVTLASLSDLAWLGALFADGSQSYSGGLDEFAYWTGTALSGTQMESLANPFGVIRLTVQPSGTGLSITWNMGVLQEADEVAGPYRDVAGAASPYHVALSAIKKFYRVRLE
ncbi:MAG: immunoglobulin domain-containing protein [Candidatus Omnitrophica bacterium]|nr:immunoglobulin domain-containing protein [Candidatus Omnitrophota bacterium]